ncbi:hypothetical protein [Pontibacter cellulosilyticus]|uniref:T9SS type A sorting domain-containing protein n=1 Tax=Pontibacter cellulosilyticus TaxID=1720253 RepID=A0A923N9G1_9BACT|nr:hypothetical protein [Pontibacter cellulosilyticus]MBC5994701.1 hypothetical protein [Pontibacter cellulosilyticus]
MKKFTSILYSTLLMLFCSYIPLQTQAQSNNLGEMDCMYISPDGCFAVGYVSVTPSTNSPGNSNKVKLYDVELFFQDVCGVITEIRIPQSQGKPFVITDAEITATLDTRIIQVNANAFDNNGSLKLTIEFDNNQKEKVEIIFAESLNCGIIEPLAVELTSFKGIATKSGVNLKWETASEENNSHFEVERSADGKAYEQIAKINGHGNSNIAQKYSFVDVSSMQGTNYYRLKQVDYDGKFAYSNTIAVENTLASAMQVTMSPNPCRNGDCEVLIRNSNRGTRSTLLELKDMSGKVVLTKVVQPGAVRLTPEEVRNYKGLFILTATSGNEVVHQRVVLE